jgi:hypothetical protein
MVFLQEDISVGVVENIKSSELFYVSRSPDDEKWMENEVNFRFILCI